MYCELQSNLIFPPPHLLSSIIPSFPHSDHVLTVVLGREWAEQCRGDTAPRGLPSGTHGVCQSFAGGWGQVWCHWRCWLPHSQCHEVQREGVSRVKDERDDLQHGAVLFSAVCGSNSCYLMVPVGLWRGFKWIFLHTCALSKVTLKEQHPLELEGCLFCSITPKSIWFWSNGCLVALPPLWIDFCWRVLQYIFRFIYLREDATWK